MDIRSKDEILDIIAKDLVSIHSRRAELSKNLEDNVGEHLEYLRALFAQFSQSTSGLVVAKTPKLTRKRAIHYIETIPEDDLLEHQQRDSSSDSALSINEEEREANEEPMYHRSKRVASQRAMSNIKLQQNTPMFHKKQKKLSNNETYVVAVKRNKRESQIKRKKITSSSDEDDGKRDAKYSKLDKNLTEQLECEIEINKECEEIAQPEEAVEKIKEQNASPKLRCSNRSGSKRSQSEEMKKIDDAIVAPTVDDVDEPSMYEDAICKPIPLMNSTLKHGSILPERMLNATVVLEPLQVQVQKKLNETVVIQKASSQRTNSWTRSSTDSKKALQDSTQLYKETVQDTYNGLITDDESSPETQKKETAKKQNINKLNKHVLLTSSDDEIPNTPVITHFKENLLVVTQDIKSTYKSNALFSPYAKESVKKRVEAFEQAVMHSPKPVNTDTPVRVTRTKTRAMAAAEAEAETKNTDKNVVQILARKSLAKAKKIAHLVEKQKKDGEFKEDREKLPERINKLYLNDKLKHQQHLKETPLSKIKVPPPVSANRLHTPSNAQNLTNYSKALTASRANIITSMDSLIQVPKTITKTTSTEKLEEKKRHEEDAKKKREDNLRLLTEEKRRKRQEKERKNKLAREAKEKQELEKRQKTEREREEKARIAQLMQEKQREEMERKRLAQLQRAQEKEERRKLEEQQRLQRLQEQEEAERLLAEQRRREQEVEKRREAEARAQQQAAIEAQKQKQQVLAAQVKYKQVNNKQGVTNYVLDSEPDDDESDDETKPKHEIPYWAQKHVRKTQLAMQLFIPQEVVYKLFDTRKCTPDLAELFHGIDRKRLKRTSSAIWKTPPRFSLMEIK